MEEEEKRKFFPTVRTTRTRGEILSLLFLSLLAVLCSMSCDLFKSISMAFRFHTKESSRARPIKIFTITSAVFTIRLEPEI